MPELSSTAWLIAALVALIVGVSKTALPGMGIVVVPMLAMVLPARQSVGALLPLLIAADIVALLLYRRHADVPLLLRLLVPTAFGIGAGLVLLRAADDATLRPFLGGLILALLALELVRRRAGWKNLPHAGWFTALTGMATGFSTTVGNVAGPIMNLYLLSRGMDKGAFMGTIAWFFLVVNCAKVPLFATLGMINADTLRLDLLLLPLVLAGTFIGRRLLPVIPLALFERLILLLAALGAIRLLF